VAVPGPSWSSALQGKAGGEGVFERFVRGEGVVLARTAAERLGVEAGEKLALVVQSRRVELEVLAAQKLSGE